MASPKFDRERAVAVILDSYVMGRAQACKKHGVAIRTLQHYEQKLHGDPELARACGDIARRQERGSGLARSKFLNDTLEHLRTLCLKAQVHQIKDVSDAIEKVGNLEIATRALVGDSAHPEGPAAEEAAGDDEGEPNAGDVEVPRAPTH